MRFLRSRGDAPDHHGPLRAAYRVPPLTRRCAVSDPPVDHVHVGSSAHAEMRPRVHHSPSGLMRFLRSRGDAHVVDAGTATADGVPPLTRRCARDDRAPRGRREGSSAHAEMRPSSRTGPAGSTWFLRSRGDAPHVFDRCLPNRVVPPLTRRCAADWPRGDTTRRGSSAHAEMRRRLGMALGGRRGFLRSRGDAPCAESLALRRALVPPLTRRCAHVLQAYTRQARGSSAHAEMRRKRSVHHRWCARFLRSRGDAPSGARRGRAWSTVPPLTRRCARAVLRWYGLAYGSSAHAEMRLEPVFSAGDYIGFLRSRGDAPLHGFVLRVRRRVPPLTRRCALTEAAL